MLAILLVSVIFVALRFILPFESKVVKKDIFKDMAHIWVGVLIGMAFYDSSYWFVAIGITAFEVIAFFYHKK